jgi:hypothetical protein
MLPECHQLALDTTPNEVPKVDEKRELTIRNADTYVWYALVSDSTRNTSDFSLLTQYASRTLRSRRYAQNNSPNRATRQETMTALLTVACQTRILGMMTRPTGLATAMRTAVLLIRGLAVRTTLAYHTNQTISYDFGHRTSTDLRIHYFRIPYDE